MIASRTDKEAVFKTIIENDLKPYVKKIDADGFYAGNFIRRLGEADFYSSTGLTKEEIQHRERSIIKETAKTCMTTAFCLWCHFALLTYVRHSENNKLKDILLNRLENGEVLGGTGLSNPLKYYAGLEKTLFKSRAYRRGILYFRLTSLCF